jgi:hypothetical protein
MQSSLITRNKQRDKNKKGEQLYECKFQKIYQHRVGGLPFDGTCFPCCVQG